MAPVDAVEKLLAKTGWDRDKDVDLVELNEAFAVAAIAVTRQLKLNPEKVNVNGGAVAIGHPIGASGARILVTLLYELQRRNLQARHRRSLPRRRQRRSPRPSNASSHEIACELLRLVAGVSSGFDFVDGFASSSRSRSRAIVAGEKNRWQSLAVHHLPLLHNPAASR